MKMKKLLWLFAIALFIGVAMIGLGLSGVKSEAINATAVTLTATDGEQTVLIDAVETATYSWDPETASLTLNGYSGRMISTNGDINLHLKGENTLTMNATQESDTLYGINLNYCESTATISADAGGELNIVGTGLQSCFSAIAGHIFIKNGTINIDLDTSSSGMLYAFERSVDFDSETSEIAEINVLIERTSDSNSFIYAFYNGAYMNNRENVEINIDLKGSENDTLYGFSDLSIRESSPIIVVDLDNKGGYGKNLRAANNIQDFSFTEGGYVEFNGAVRRNGISGASNEHTITTTPANND